MVSSAVAGVGFWRERISNLANSTFARPTFCESKMKYPRGQTYKIYIVLWNCSTPAVHFVNAELPQVLTRPAFSLHLGRHVFGET
jgi:hypothetical protein